MPRAAARLLALLTLAVLASPALAQSYSYVASYSSGTWHSSGDSGSVSGSFGGTSWSCTTYSGGFDGAGGHPAGAGSCDDEGPVTATFTWSGPTGTEPSVVVVQQTASAGWQGDSGSCSDGLGGTPVANGDSGASSTKTVYSVKQSPGHSFALSAVDPSASATLNGGGGGAGDDSVRAGRAAGATGPRPFATALAASASVSYSATATPVVVSVAGTINDGSGHDAILVGQGATGTFSAGGYTIDPSSYQWSVGGDRFASWVVSSDQSTGTLNYVPSSTWASVSPHWYWADDQNGIVVSCTATIVTPDGASRSVSATRNVDVYPPTYSFANNTASRSTIRYTGGSGADPFQGTDVVASYVDATGVHDGETFVGAVVTPDQFGPDGGSWNFLQIATPSRVHSGVDGTRYDPYYGQAGLDNGWPYDVVPLGETQPTWGAPAAGATLNEAMHKAVDSPVTSNLNSETSYSIDDSYEMSLMYRPPGSDTQYVRLNKFVWAWTGADSRPNFFQYWSDPPPLSIVAVSSDHDALHPTWNQKVTNTGE